MLIRKSQTLKSTSAVHFMAVWSSFVELCIIVVLYTSFSYVYVCVCCVTVHVLPDKPMCRRTTEEIPEDGKISIGIKCEKYSIHLFRLYKFVFKQVGFIIWFFWPPEDFIKAFRKAHEVPTKKYSMPLTESQEIGWMSTPLVSKTLLVDFGTNCSLNV